MMGYFSKQVGRSVVATKSSRLPAQPSADLLSSAFNSARPRLAAQVGKLLPEQNSVSCDYCPRCNGVLAEDDGFARCGGRCQRRWVVGGPGRWLDPATLPLGVCSCCRPRQALVAAAVGAICPGSHTEYVILPEGVIQRAAAASLGICRCCLPPQPLAKTASGLVCRNKPQQHYQIVQGVEGVEEVVWMGLAPALDQATVTAAIDAALSENNAKLTLFGLFASPTER